MRAGFRMHGDDVGASFGEGLDEGIARRDHQMHVEDLLRVWAERRDDVGADGDVRHEMPVHHVDMDPVGARLVDRAHLLAEPREIGRQDRRGDDDVSGHGSLSLPASHHARLMTGQPQSCLLAFARQVNETESLD